MYKPPLQSITAVYCDWEKIKVSLVSLSSVGS